MLQSNTCVDLLMETLTSIWTFLKSEDSQIFFGAWGIVSAMMHYLKKSALKEANELWAALFALFVVLAMIAMTEGAVPVAMRQVAQCKTGNRGIAPHWIGDRGAIGN
jgi:hypothetical protein